MIVCPYCHRDSADPLFCDNCNGILPPPAPSALPCQIFLGDGRPVDCSAWKGAWPVDFWKPLATSAGSRPCRAYALNHGWWSDQAALIRERAAFKLDVLASVEIVLVGDGAVVVADGQECAGKPLLESADGDELMRLQSTLDACRALAAALEPLHRAGLVWLNFDPAALEVTSTGSYVTNLDLQLFRIGTCPDSLRISDAYSPPEVWGFRDDWIGPATDVFHVSVYLYYRLAGLLPDGFPGQGLQSFDFDIPSLRIYRPNLPAGIAHVLERGIARNPSERFATAAELVSELSEAVERVRRRHQVPEAISWTAGSASFVGRSHAVQDLPNQDAHLVATLPGNRLLAIVADGVTHARHGSGDVASQAAVAVFGCCIPERLEEGHSLKQIEEALSGACLEASKSILDLAEAVLPPEGFDPVDVMSSTVVAGVLSDNILTLASVGDSRAYLIAEGRAEQLTVDGDVLCTQLARGDPPELVRGLGTETSALYSCLGVGEPVDGGGLELCLARSLPALSHWPLLPGDVVVLCSDGLIEEGVFLEPAELPLLLAESAGQPADELAAGLVQAALSRHRDPSPSEPTGCGDDVTCIVVLIGAAQVA